jgi:hypothetical protein
VANGSPSQKKQQLAFARINRRPQQPMDLPPFRQVVLAMVSARDLYADRGDKKWIAADFELRYHETMLVGIIGYTTIEIRTQFDLTEWSWLKGPQAIESGATNRTLAPFAIDLREKNRWVAFAPKGYLNVRSFPAGLRAILFEGLSRQRQGFLDWDVDIVGNAIALREWVEQHPHVRSMKLTLRMTNPGRDLSSDREAMRAIGAGRLDKIYYPKAKTNLHVEGELRELEEELGGTDVDVKLTARERGGPVSFDSKTSREQRFVDAFGDDLRTGMDLVAEALVQFATERTPPTLTGDPSDEPT